MKKYLLILLTLCLFLSSSFGTLGQQSSQQALLGKGGSTAPFSPSDIAGLIGWWKADALVLTNGDPVGTWTDSSSAANNATQGTAAKKPTYVTGVVNSLPVVRFDGSDDNLPLSTNITDSTITVFIVANFSGGGGTKAMLVMDAVAVMADDSTGNYATYAGGYVTYGATTTGSFVDFYLNSRAANDIDLAINTSLVNRTTGTSYPARGASAIGSDPSNVQYFSGDIAEIILYDSPLGNTDRDNVREYLRSKYALY